MRATVSGPAGATGATGRAGAAGFGNDGRAEGWGGSSATLGGPPQEARNSASSGTAKFAMEEDLIMKHPSGSRAKMAADVWPFPAPLLKMPERRPKRTRWGNESVRS